MLRSSANKGGVEDGESLRILATDQQVLILLGSSGGLGIIQHQHFFRILGPETYSVSWDSHR